MKVNNELCVDLKTRLLNDAIMKPQKKYTGILRREASKEELFGNHFTFRETQPSTAGKRNPHVFIGKYITVTRRDDGSLRLNFRPVTMGADFNIYRYATGVFSELLRALRGLIGKEAAK